MASQRSRRRVLYAGVLATVVAGATAVAAAAHTDGQTAKAAPNVAQAARADAHTLVIGVSSDPQTMDPEFGQATRANELIKNIYAQWVHYKTINTGKGYLRADVKTVVGDALSSWTAKKDGTVVLNVRKGAKFPDGTPVTADDLVYKIQRSLGVNAGSVFDFNILGLTKLTQVKKTGPYTRDGQAAARLPDPRADAARPGRRPRGVVAGEEERHQERPLGPQLARPHRRRRHRRLRDRPEHPRHPADRSRRTRATGARSRTSRR